MKIAEGYDVKIGVFDIETLAGCFDVGIYDPDSKVWYEYQITKYKNDLYSLLEMYTSNRFDYWVSFNGVEFDHQVLEYIVENHEKWIDLSNLEIVNEIYEFVQMHIDNKKYDIRSPYTEFKFQVRPIDLFKIHHFDNEARMTS